MPLEQPPLSCVTAASGATDSSRRFAPPASVAITHTLFAAMARRSMASRRPALPAAATGVAAALVAALALAVTPSPAAAELPAVSYLLSNFQLMGLGQGSSSAVRSLDDELYFWGDQIPVGSERTTSQYTWLSVDGHTGYECGIERVTLQTMCWGTDKQVCRRDGWGGGGAWPLWAGRGVLRPRVWPADGIRSRGADWAVRLGHTIVGWTWPNHGSLYSLLFSTACSPCRTPVPPSPPLLLSSSLLSPHTGRQQQPQGAGAASFHWPPSRVRPDL